MQQLALLLYQRRWSQSRTPLPRPWQAHRCAFAAPPLRRSDVHFCAQLSPQAQLLPCFNAVRAARAVLGEAAARHHARTARVHDTVAAVTGQVLRESMERFSEHIASAVHRLPPAPVLLAMAEVHAKAATCARAPCRSDWEVVLRQLPRPSSNAAAAVPVATPDLQALLRACAGDQERLLMFALEQHRLLSSLRAAPHPAPATPVEPSVSHAGAVVLATGCAWGPVVHSPPHPGGASTRDRVPSDAATFSERERAPVSAASGELDRGRSAGAKPALAMLAEASTCRQLHAYVPRTARWQVAVHDGC